MDRLITQLRIAAFSLQAGPALPAISSKRMVEQCSVVVLARLAGANPTPPSEHIRPDGRLLYIKHSFGAGVVGLCAGASGVDADATAQKIIIVGAASERT